MKQIYLHPFSISPTAKLPYHLEERSSFACKEEKNR
jgi:hypothetical protein